MFPLNTSVHELVIVTLPGKGRCTLCLSVLSPVAFPFPSLLKLLPSEGCPDYHWGEGLPGGEQPPCPVWIRPLYRGQGDRAQGPDPGRGQSR